MFFQKMIPKISAQLAAVAALLCLAFASSLYAENIVSGNVQDSSSNNLPDAVLAKVWQAYCSKGETGK